MYEGPEFRHLRYFVAVAEECNFCRAAARLHVSQPALSSQIHQLEDGLGAPLFLRGHAGASLTPAGQDFLSHARQMLLMRDRAVQNASSVHSGAETPFRFGYCPFVNHELVHEAIRGFREMMPNGIIEPSSECSGPLSAMVAEGQLDAALVTFPIAEKDRLFVQLVCSEDLLICLRADDLLAKETAIPREAVEERLKILIHRDHHPLLYDELMRRFLKAGIQLEPSDFVSAMSEMQFLMKEKDRVRPDSGAGSALPGADDAPDRRLVPPHQDRVRLLSGAKAAGVAAPLVSAGKIVRRDEENARAQAAERPRRRGGAGEAASHVRLKTSGSGAIGKSYGTIGKKY